MPVLLVVFTHRVTKKITYLKCIDSSQERFSSMLDEGKGNLMHETILVPASTESEHES